MFAQRVEGFLVATGMSPSKFGELVANDKAFVADLRGGKREFKASTQDKVSKWMDGYETALADLKPDSSEQAA